MKNAYAHALFSLLFLSIPYLSKSQFGCAGNNQGSIQVDLITVSAINQGQDAVITAEYEYSFFFQVRDNFGNLSSSNCWEWDPNDNQANSVSPGSSGTSGFQFFKGYTGCNSFGMNADFPTSLQFSFDGWEDDSGGRCSFNTGTFINNDDDRYTCGWGNDLDLTAVFTDCPGGTATYDHTFTCGHYTMTYRITLNLPPFDPTINAPSTICSSTPAIQLGAVTPGGTWSGTGVNATGLFDPSNLASGSYNITYTGTNGCVTSSDDVVITVLNPDASFATPPVEMCANSSAFALTPVDPLGLWTVTNGGVIINGEFDPQVNGPGEYLISYTVGDNTLNCTETVVASNTVTVHALPTFEIQGPAQASACGGPVFLAANELVPSTSGNYTYSWSGLGIFGANDTESVVVVGLVDGTTDYTLTVTDGNGCEVTTTFQVTFDCSLPIELLSFKGQPLNSGIELIWSTSMELDNEGFFLERSLDGLDFEPITFIEGAGTSTEQQDYRYVDESLLPVTLYYYRLIQRDFDGMESPSEIISIRTNPRDWGNDIVVSEAYPNPAVSLSTLEVKSPVSGPAIVHFYDTTGKMVFEQNDVFEVGQNSLSLDLQNLASGLYHVVLSFDNRRFTRKIVKMNP